LINFTPVSAVNGTGPVPTISEDYQYDVLIPWGTSIQPGGPEYNGDPTTRPTAAEQAQQVGIGHDGMWLFPIGDSNDRGMLAINHEFGTNPHVLGKRTPESLEDVRLSQHAHGVSVVEIQLHAQMRLVSSVHPTVKGCGAPPNGWSVPFVLS
jgi:hypothetical protein